MIKADILFELHTKVADELVKRLTNGTATPADINSAIKFLKDNGIQLEQKEENDPMLILLEDLNNAKKVGYKKDTNDDIILENMLNSIEYKSKN